MGNMLKTKLFHKSEKNNSGENDLEATRPSEDTLQAQNMRDDPEMRGKSLFPGAKASTGKTASDVNNRSVALIFAEGCFMLRRARGKWPCVRCTIQI